jgi:hypothetical protein
VERSGEEQGGQKSYFESHAWNDLFVRVLKAKQSGESGFIVPTHDDETVMDGHPDVMGTGKLNLLR